MAYATNWTDLKEDLIRIVEDDSTDYADNIPTIVAAAETQLLRDLDLEIFQSEGTQGALIVGNRIFVRPPELIKINGLWLEVGGSRKYIEKRTRAYCEAYGEDGTHGRPVYYAETNETSLMFVATPDLAYPVITYGIVRPEGLSDANETTWLSTNAGDLLLLACLVQSEQYLTNPTKADIWKGEYSQDRLPKAKLELRGATRADYEMSRSASTATTPL